MIPFRVLHPPKATSPKHVPFSSHALRSPPSSKTGTKVIYALSISNSSQNTSNALYTKRFLWYIVLFNNYYLLHASGNFVII